MDVNETVTKILNKLQNVVDSCDELSLFHIHPNKARRLGRFAQRADSLREEIEEDYDL